MKTRIISRTLLALTLGLVAPMVVSPVAASADETDAGVSQPTIEILTPTKGAPVEAYKTYEMRVRVTGPINGRGTIHFTFSKADPRVNMSKPVDLNDKGVADISFLAGPNQPGPIGVFARVEFGGVMSEMFYTEWNVVPPSAGDAGPPDGGAAPDGDAAPDGE